MPRGRPTPTLDLRLSRQLRELRKAARMSGEQAADKIGWSPSKISRIERMRTGIGPADTGMLCDLYGADAATRARLVDLAEQGEDGAGAMDAYRTDAVSVSVWGPSVIPPPLRVPDYARAVADSAAEVTMSLPSETAGAAADARAWAKLVEARRDPLAVAAVIDGSALRRLVGGPAVMLRQVEHLSWLVSRSNADLRVLPIDAGGPAGVAAFTLLSYGPGLADVAVFDDTASPAVAEDEAGTYRSRRAFRELRGCAVDAPPAISSALTHWRARAQ